MSRRECRTINPTHRVITPVNTVANVITSGTYTSGGFSDQTAVNAMATTNMTGATSRQRYPTTSNR
ncbi:hypothetical protein Xph01_57270 [Micromonospora phaseoli]|nr:hypothetical protein Xph01_57270 [Micromonospora phaseoli]